MTNNEFIVNANAAIDARISYENVKSDSKNATIVAKLNAIRKTITHTHIADVLIASNYNVDSINEQVRVSNRRNVYSIEKDANAARFIASVAALNHYTLAVFKTALALEAASHLLTHKSAQASCSQDVKCSDAKIERIVKTTRYAKHIDASTASTQSSSSINALEALNVLSVSRNDSNEITYRLNRDAYATQAIAKRLELSLEVASTDSVEA